LNVDDNQLGLVFEAPPIAEPTDPKERASIDERFAQFRAAYPEVIEYVRKLALEAVRAGLGGRALEPLECSSRGRLQAQQRLPRAVRSLVDGDRARAR
jgi:hypothetical protein